MIDYVKWQYSNICDSAPLAMFRLQQPQLYFRSSTYWVDQSKANNDRAQDRLRFFLVPRLNSEVIPYCSFSWQKIKLKQVFSQNRVGYLCPSSHTQVYLFTHNPRPQLWKEPWKRFKLKPELWNPLGFAKKKKKDGGWGMITAVTDSFKVHVSNTLRVLYHFRYFHWSIMVNSLYLYDAVLVPVFAIHQFT